MGFCMAEIGLNLVVTKSATELAASWPSLLAFAISFYFVSVLWWFHHKLFVAYFVLMPLTVVLNFVMLGALALAVYFQEVTAQFFIGDVRSPLPILCWMACLAVVYGIVSLQYAIGIAKRRATLDAQAMAWGVNRALRTATVALLVATFAISYGIFRHVTTPLYVMVAVFAAFGLARRRIAPLIAARLLTAPSDSARAS
jgi:uncharacterized membrane protein